MRTWYLTLIHPCSTQPSRRAGVALRVPQSGGPQHLQLDLLVPVVPGPGAGVRSAPGVSAPSDGASEETPRPARPQPVNIVRWTGVAATSAVTQDTLSVSVAGSRASASPVAVLGTTCVTVACFARVRDRKVLLVTVRCQQGGASELFQISVSGTCPLYLVGVEDVWRVVGDGGSREMEVKVAGVSLFLVQLVQVQHLWMVRGLCRRKTSGSHISVRAGCGDRLWPYQERV